MLWQTQRSHRHLSFVLPLLLGACTPPSLETQIASPAPPALPALESSHEARRTLDTVDRRVVLTIDDLPLNSTRSDLATSQRVTESLLSVLSSDGVPAIGFVNESKLGAENPEPARVALLEAWLDAGIELGNHTFGHLDLHQVSRSEFEANILRGERITRSLADARGIPYRFFRHPFLHTGRDLETRDGVVAFLAEKAYRVAPVTIDNGEWVFARAYDRALDRGSRKTADRLAAAYLRYMDDVFAYYEQQSVALLGREIPQVLLIHANRLHADYLAALLSQIAGRGYRFVPLAEALQDEAYRHADTFTGSGGITWLHRWALTEGHRGDFFAGEPEVEAWVYEEARIEH